MEACKKTRSVYLWNSLLNAPLWSIYSLLVFIFYKDLHATPLQLTLLICAKPAVAVVSFYFSSFIDKRQDRLRLSIILASALGQIPCFFFPLTNSIWFFIGAFAIYMMSIRAVIPAWMEILKLKLPSEARSKLFSHGSSINYLAGLFIPLLISYWMDIDIHIWRRLFPAAALLSLSSTLFLLRIPIAKRNSGIPNPPLSLPKALLQPWKSAWRLIISRPDFGHFQAIFMLGGLGLMIMQPALPIFCVDILHLTYTELALAISVCKGIGFALTSRLWASWINRVNLFLFSGIVTLAAALFPILIMSSASHVTWLYIAYLVYGIMQAGSELSWHLSGPIFAKEQDSSYYTGVNVVLVGLRGCIGPSLGGLLCVLFNWSLPLMAGGACCLLGSFYAMYSSKRFARKSEELQTSSGN